MGPREVVMKIKKQLKGLFETKDVGEMDEYVGCRIDHLGNEQIIKMTQPVKIRWFEGEYDKGIIKGLPCTPFEAGVLLKEEGEESLDLIAGKED